MSTSRSPLPDLQPPVVSLDLLLDGCGDALGCGDTPEDCPDEAGRYTLLPGNLAEIRSAPTLPAEQDQFRDKLDGQFGTSATCPHYAETDTQVKSNIPFRFSSADAQPLAESVFRLRKAIGYSQKQLADALGVLQSRVAKWESGSLKPSGPICAALARLAPDDEQEYWLAHAGLSHSQQSQEESGIRWVPLLRDPAAAGTPRAIDDREIEEMIPFPKGWLPSGGSLFAIKVTGDSMSPLLEEGYIALVDVANRNLHELEDKMVAARDGARVTLKWLRKQGDIYLLVPQNASRHPVGVWMSGDEKALIGEVVSWLGKPPLSRVGHAEGWGGTERRKLA